MIVRPIGRLLGGITAFASVFACVPHARQDACSGGGAVSGDFRYTAVSDADASSYGRRLSNVTIAALVAREDGTIAACPGAGDDNGSYTIPRAPAGRFMLQVGSDFFVTSQRSLTFNSAFLGPSDFMAASSPPEITFNVSALDPWSTGDSLEVYSDASPVYLFDPQASSPPADGATSATFGVEWSADNGAYLSHPSGDPLWITQLVDRGTDPPQLAVARSARIKPVIQDGVSRRIDATLSDAGESGEIVTAWRRSRFQEVAARGNPVASVYGDIFSVFTMPRLDTYGVYDLWADLLETRIAGAVPGDTAFSRVPYANPFGWVVGYRASSFQFIDVELPGGGNAQVLARTTTDDFIANLQSEVVPQTAPVTGLTVAGGDPFTDRDGIGPTPDLAWTLPSPLPDEVQVDVEDVSENAGETVLKRVARIHVPRDEDAGGVRIPDVLTPGHRYVFVVRAVVQPAVDKLHDPLAESLPKAISEVVTSSFTP